MEPYPLGVTLVSPEAINEKGEVAGTLLMDNGISPRAFFWSPSRGFIHPLGEGMEASQGAGLDDDGNVVGYFGNQREAFIWNEARGLRSLVLRLPYLYTLGASAGQVFGNALGAREGLTVVFPYRLDLASSRVEELPVASGAGGGVYDVNRLNEAVGYDGYIDHGFGGTSDAVIWDRSGTRTIVLPCGGEWGCFAYLYAINADGLAVGSLTKEEGQIRRVFRWSRATGLEFLGVPGGGYDVGVVDVSDDGSILAKNGTQGFIFKPTGAVTVIKPPADRTIVQPRTMNRHGQVVGMLF